MDLTPRFGPFRILCIGETWLGSDARSAFAAFRRLGNSVQVIDDNNYVPIRLKTKPSKILRRLFKALYVRELMLEVRRLINSFHPHFVFVFKGTWVHPDLLEYCRAQDIPVLNYYPDVSFMAHGPYIPKSLPLYLHVFNTKSYGVHDMKTQLGVTNISFLEPGFDPDLHRPVKLTAEDRSLYGCDVSFIGTWSAKKEILLAGLAKALPRLRMKIWGCQWEKSRSPGLADFIIGDEVTGDAYTKAICSSSICLGLLSEARRGSSSGDLITARTFQIPACGTFMLHERNTEVLSYFDENIDAAFFNTAGELAEKVRYYLEHSHEREQIAKNGLERSLRDEYAIDGRMKIVLRWFEDRLNVSVVS